MSYRSVRIIERFRDRPPEWSRPRVWAVLGLCFILALLLGGALVADFADPPSVVLFVGRFHPLVVHFPIGLIMLAGLLEGAGYLYRPLRRLRYATTFVLFLGAVGAVLAVVAGYFLSLEGGYDPALLERHTWMGFAVAVSATAATALKFASRRKRSPILLRAYGGTLLLSLTAVVLAGHLGGTLTRGPGYLTHHLPQSLRLLVPLSDPGARTRIVDIDSAYVYHDLVRPLLVARCVSCHSESKLRGGLRLDTPEGLLHGGEHGPVLVPGDPDGSELLTRVTLPPTARGAMPPNRARPLDVGETELIRWWIAHGASFEHQVADIEEIPTSVATLFNRLAPPRGEKRHPLYALDAPAVDPRELAAVRSAGFRIAPVAQDLALLEVSAVNLRSSLSDADLQKLLPVAQHIAWLDLSATRVGDAGLAVVQRMPNLVRLRLDRTAVSDHGVRHLAGLENLEYLNLFGTGVTDAGLEHLAELRSLQVLYLWQTRVTENGVQQLQRHRPGLRVDLGTVTPEGL